MNYLAIESSGFVCGVSLVKNKRLIDTFEIDRARSHQKKLAVFTNNLLEKHKTTISELDFIAVSSGPGSFLGLRIGMSFAKGLCHPFNIPLIPVQCFDYLNFQVGKEIKDYFIVIHSNRDMVYCQKYKNNKKSGATQYIDFKKIKSENVFSIGNLESFVELNCKQLELSSKHIANYVMKNINDLNKVEVQSALPDYMQDFVIKQKKQYNG